MSITDIIIVPAVALVLFAVIARWTDILPAKAAFLFLALGLLSCSIISIISISRYIFSGFDGFPGLAIILGIVPLCLLSFYFVKAFTHPAIHDVATRYTPDITFVHALNERGGSDNPLDRPAQEREEQDTYKLKSLVLQGSVDEVRSQIVDYAAEHGWRQLGATHSALEYAVTTPLFRFTDDLRIELREEGGKTVIDARSVSRMGKSDLGANAARIESLFSALR